MNRRSILLGAVLALGLASCDSQSDKRPSSPAEQPSAGAAPAGPAPCPASFSNMSSTDADQSCVCAAGEPRGKVYGSGIYSPESAICAAAVHAGALTTEGGTVTFRGAQGCPSYLGSTNNRVTTFTAEAAQRSFFFPSVSDGRCGPK